MIIKYAGNYKVHRRRESWGPEYFTTKAKPTNTMIKQITQLWHKINWGNKSNQIKERAIHTHIYMQQKQKLSYDTKDNQNSDVQMCKRETKKPTLHHLKKP